MIVRGTRQLGEHFHTLKRGDVFIGPLVFKHLKSNLLIDLLERGIICLPSVLAQVLSGSKTTQAYVLKEFMLPHTRVIRRRHDLIQAMADYTRSGIGPTVTKADHLHCGHGIRRWDHIEMLYNVSGFDPDAYPFVLQPFVSEPFTDVRIILAAGYVEAYRRINPLNFRKNLSLGAESKSFRPSTRQLSFCRRVMERGRFPYAHLDLMVFADGSCFLSEIALDGGIKGATISRSELKRLKEQQLEDMAAEYENLSS